MANSSRHSVSEDMFSSMEMTLVMNYMDRLLRWSHSLNFSGSSTLMLFSSSKEMESLSAIFKCTTNYYHHSNLRGKEWNFWTFFRICINCIGEMYWLEFAQDIYLISFTIWKRKRRSNSMMFILGAQRSSCLLFFILCLVLRVVYSIILKWLELCTMWTANQ